MKRTLWLCALMAASSLGCVESITPPELLPQGVVDYGPRVYLMDTSRDNSEGICRRLTQVLDDSPLRVMSSTITRPIAPVSTGLEDVYAALMATDGEGALSERERAQPQNCFVPMAGDAERRTLRVDSLETPNLLFQVCRDSEHCLEPDPSEADQNDVCQQTEDAFFDCPVVSVSRQDAEEFCRFIGRRLPTAIEAIIIRQHGWTAGPDGTRAPESFRRFPAADPSVNELTSCEAAHLGFGSNLCDRPEPLRFQGELEGAASQDRLETRTSTVPLFDLTGHVAEWVADGFISDQPIGAPWDLPWFCIGPVQQDTQTGAPVCPEPPPGMTPDGEPFQALPCAYGYYDPDAPAVDITSLGLDNGLFDPARPLPYGLYPVCVTSGTGRLSGGRGALIGGGWKDPSSEGAGVFGLRFESDLAQLDTLTAEAYGIRCVDDLRPGTTELQRPTLPLDPNFDPGEF